MDSTRRWKEPEDAAVRVPLYLLGDRSLEDQSLPAHLYQELGEPDEHTTDPGVGAADTYCVFYIGELEPQEDDE